MIYTSNTLLHESKQDNFLLVPADQNLTHIRDIGCLLHFDLCEFLAVKESSQL